MSPSSPALDPAVRLLCGPGPSNVSPAALAAMQAPMLGHLDPELHAILLDVSARLAAAYQSDGGLTLAMPATGTSGMEAGLCNLLEPGDELIVGVNGFFGARIAEIARRHGAQVVEVTAPLGQAVPNAHLLEALARHPRARMMAVVHAETSTGVQHPLRALGDALRGSDVLLMADCVTSLGGVELDVAGWGIDYAYSCTQKCVGAPPGMSPVFVSERALARIHDRRTPVPFSLDLLALERYWRARPATYHHTAPILAIYALHAALGEIADETLSARWARHTQAGGHLQALLTGAGLELFADPEHQLAPLTAVRVPDGVDGAAVQRRMLREHGIEIGGGLGPSAPPIWRIGLMGVNATVATAERVAEALDAVLEAEAAFSAVA
ncbi:MAG TPA: aminotransferase class V-fold PLP-dependent enzyme [Solirubrobacteraceae bacterium]|nr:aminotransferase class V-fold PLP-dependent enzyme [Solirubrobacteraceae bacterium]